MVASDASNTDLLYQGLGPTAQAISISKGMIQITDELDKRLHTPQEEYNRMQIPVDTSHSIQAGIQKAQGRRRTRQRWFISLIATSAALLIFTGCIRVSPAFASYIKQIPGMEGFVALIEHDSGIMDAVDHELFQPIRATDEHNGLAVTVDGVIADESRMILFYTVKGTEQQLRSLDRVDLRDDTGERLPVSYSYDHNHDKSSKEYSDYVDMLFPEGTTLPKTMSVQFYSSQEANAEHWEVTFPVDVSLTQGMKRSIPVGQTLTLDGQLIHIRKVILSPLRLQLDLEYDAGNSKEIFNFSQLELVDERGRSWQSDTALATENERSVYFESMYFTIPEQLILKASGITALDKNLLDVRIDPTSLDMEGGPDGLVYEGSKVVGQDLQVRFSLEPGGSAERLSTVSFSTVKDLEGTEYMIKQATGSFDQGTRSETVLTIENGANAHGPLLMKISSYPLQIDSPIQLDIPLIGN